MRHRQRVEREYLVHLTHVKSFISEWLSHPAPASDSNVGLIPYNYPSHGNDCILSFQTDNSIWTQVIRFLGCGWYLSIICPVERQGMAARSLAAAAWNTNDEASPLLHSGNLAHPGFVGFEACIFFPSFSSSLYGLAWLEGNGDVNGDRLPAYAECAVIRRFACSSMAQSRDQIKPYSSTKKWWVLTGFVGFQQGINCTATLLNATSHNTPPFLIKSCIYFSFFFL